jgi:hypothetical protein
MVAALVGIVLSEAEALWVVAPVGIVLSEAEAYDRGALRRCRTAQSGRSV